MADAFKGSVHTNENETCFLLYLCWYVAMQVGLVLFVQEISVSEYLSWKEVLLIHF